MKNIATVKQAIEALSEFPIDHPIIGNCIDEFDNCYNYPVFINENDNMVVIQLKPYSEDEIDPDEHPSHINADCMMELLKIAYRTVYNEDFPNSAVSVGGVGDSRTIATPEHLLSINEDWSINFFCGSTPLHFNQYPLYRKLAEWGFIIN